MMSGVAAYLPIPNMSPVLCEELHEDLQKLAYEGKVENFAAMRALSHALSSVGLPLHIFDTPADLGPLETGQERCMEDGEYVIKDMKPGQVFPQIPKGLDLDSIPVIPDLTVAFLFIFGASKEWHMVQYCTSP